MQIEQKIWQKTVGWKLLSSELSAEADLVLVFGERTQIEEEQIYEEVRSMYKKAQIVIGSSAAEIIDSHVYDDSLVLTAISFDSTKVKAVSGDIKSGKSLEVGASLGKAINGQKLKHVLVFSDGLVVNGSRLVEGVQKELAEHVGVTGGLVGDDDRFERTLLGLNEEPITNQVVLVGFYGDKLSTSHGTFGGWDDFGPSRVITKSDGNILYELDGKPALDLYKKYLGEKADELPASGLLFPLSLDLEGKEVVRTLLSVDEEQNSMTFAGDMPMGVSAKLMKANFERLINGAATAAQSNVSVIEKNKADFALLVSCVGRRLVLGSRVEEEVEAVQAVLGESVKTIGFYSYGEISPSGATEQVCQLHNQTMTITTFREE